MRYMVIMRDSSAFMTDWYRYGNCWTEDIFCVVDTCADSVTFDGREWQDAGRDHL